MSEPEVPPRGPAVDGHSVDGPAVDRPVGSTPDGPVPSTAGGPPWSTIEGTPAAGTAAEPEAEIAGELESPSEREAEPDIGTAIDIRDLRKRYGDTIALGGLTLVCRPGEILGVAGPNGAGKSTLIKILAGEVPPDGGEILVDGTPWSPAGAQRRIAVVHQEPQVFPNLTVAENIVIGRERRRWLRRSVNAQERALMSDLAIAEFADVLIERTTLAVQQRTQIARALAQDARVFLFDEPNSALTEEESDDLFRRMHRLAESGRVVILVSHRLAELVAHCQRVAIILDGQCRTTFTGDALTQDAIARQLVVGHPDRPAAEALERAAREEGSTLRLDGWSHARDEFRDIQLQVRPGEIVALVGVEGSGARELVRSIAGLEPARGRIEIGGESGPTATGRRTAFVSADRRDSLFGNLSVGENVVSRLGHEIADRFGLLRYREMVRLAAEVRDSFRIKVTSMKQPIGSLSGGNQQKVAIAAAVIRRPQALILEEPTRGVDIGSKREIYRLLREYATRGNAVVMYCTEIPEAFEVADTVHVVSDGRLSAGLPVGRYTEVESLASDITRLEEQRRPEATAAA